MQEHLIFTPAPSRAAPAMARTASSGLSRTPPGTAQLQRLQSLADHSGRVAQLRSLQVAADGGRGKVLQARAAIRTRQNAKRRARAAIRVISAKNPLQNGDADDFRLHDAAMGAGQHHGVRNVRRSQLVADLQGRIDQHNANNDRDNQAINGNQNQQEVAQLKAAGEHLPEEEEA